MQNIVDAGSEHETVHLSAIWDAGWWDKAVNEIGFIPL
ncbi:hypothetical protein X743_15440 [Mesorhizobium sp. LNHC252B00]|nr:hypothetical protein X743_15440 [Mesorhizobium sp. LNHC252B00]